MLVYLGSTKLYFNYKLMKKIEFLKQTKWMWNEVREIWEYTIAKITFRSKFVIVDDGEKEFSKIVDKKYKSFHNLELLRKYIKNPKQD